MRLTGLKKAALTVLVLCLLLVCSSAFAGDTDFFTLNVDGLDLTLLNDDQYVMTNLSSSAPGLRILKEVSPSSELAQPVRLTLMQMDTRTLLMDKDYGYQSMTFDSGVLYLPYSSNYSTPYLITLYVGDMVYGIPYLQTQPRLSYNTGCTFGPRLRDLNPLLSYDWPMGTMLDLDALRQEGIQQVDICASNYYTIGRATLTVENNCLCVMPEFFSQANPEIHGLSIYLITDCASLSCDPAYSDLPIHVPGEQIPLGDASTALLYMPLSISYDPVGLSTFSYDLYDPALQRQIGLWDQNVCGTPSGDIAWSDSYSPSSDFQWIEVTPDPAFGSYDNDGFQWQTPEDDVILEDLYVPAE